ncbi:UDP-N-acetylmuramoyl-L-alanyl-D-glutamate--2,6-diaminopimelate ligase [Dermatobacter hominis]|nr:UDP-N-acetylmuramoyl-L-alanyl-D-glutamate--2,6-diaminopimelate ligase [Dermatobacter hominis]UDY35973.1 UDP-N-acetylmuramoyl-L-alanyl-D-glutamate--2,6-diaminopimelate ligase [Dermatobacter hominis]
MSETTVTIADVSVAVGARPAEPSGVDDSTPVVAVTHDSRRVGPGTLFCCVVGGRADGHDFAPAAVAAGAVALLVERHLDPSTLPHPVAQLLVDDVRAAMAPAAAEVYGHPAERLRTVGVTGTNGKTTVVSTIAHVLRSAGREVGAIGTLTGARTTPEATDLQAQLAQMVADGVTDVAMEVSSHALVLHRVDAMTFDVAVFTNLGQDHLDFHGTPEAYFAAKAVLFDPGRSRRGIVDVDDVRGRLLVDVAPAGHPMVPVSLADAGEIRFTVDGSSFTWRGRPVTFPLPGRHNVANALLAAEACAALGVDDDDIAAALAGVPAVPGRFEAVRAGQSFDVVVDYAHTPDALEAVLEAARELAAGRVLVVFGCGGDRDTAKRPRMGEVASAARRLGRPHLRQPPLRGPASHPRGDPVRMRG